MHPRIRQDELADRYGISLSLISKWLKNKENIIAAAVKKNKKLRKKQRKLAKYLELYRQLFEKMKAVRAKGWKVNFNWLWSRARTIQHKLTGEETVVIRKHLITTFLSLCIVRMRARQRNRKKPKEAYWDDLMKRDSVIKERLIRTGGI